MQVLRLLEEVTGHNLIASHELPTDEHLVNEDTDMSNVGHFNITDLLNSTEQEHLPEEVVDHSGGAHEETAHGGEEHSGGHHISYEVMVVLFISISLLIGGICREITKKTKIPYTPMLLVIGMLIGGYREYLGSLSIGVAVV